SFLSFPVAFRMRTCADAIRAGSITADGSRSLQAADRNLARPAVHLGVESDLLAIRQRGHAGALERGGMHEHVPAAVVRLDETEALLGVEEFYNTILHGITFSHVYAGMRDHSRPISRMRPDLSKVLERSRRV